MRARPAFTLPQLVVVILVLATLVALLLPIIQRWRERAQGEEVLAHLKALGWAAHAYNDRFKKLPPAHDGVNTCQAILAPDYQGDYDVLVHRADYSFGGPQSTTVPWTGIAANYYLFGTENNATEDITAKPGFAGLKDPVAGAKDLGYTPLAVNTIRDGTSNTIMWVTCLAEPARQNVVALGPESWPGQATGPFHAGMDWEAAPDVEKASCLSGKHAQSYTASAIAVGLADGGSRFWAMDSFWVKWDDEERRSLLLPDDNPRPQWDY